MGVEFRSGAAIDLLARKHFAALTIEDAQSYRSRRPSEICGGDDCCRRVRHLNLNFRQGYRPAIWRRADKLDSERVRHGGEDARQPACATAPRAASAASALAIRSATSAFNCASTLPACS